ncbi:MAG TPA: twin-arginine translocation signal domain-containing protein, partial [Xanthobacteraceae bacterium]|nr:twin-arginine translocation signal domain-containing protein [Xanthobacteraceae bacterium]
MSRALSRRERRGKRARDSGDGRAGAAAVDGTTMIERGTRSTSMNRRNFLHALAGAAAGGAV